MGIAEKLTTLNQIKANIKSALESKGLSPTDDFTTYANMVENVPDYKSVLNKTATNLILDSSVPTLYNYSISGYNDITVNCPETIKIEPLAFSGSSKVTLVRGSNQQVIESGQLVITKDVEINNDDNYTKSIVLKGEVASTFGVPDGTTFITAYRTGSTFEAEYNSITYELDFSEAYTAGLYVLKITSEYTAKAFPINESSTATGTILFYFESEGPRDYGGIREGFLLKNIAYSSLAKGIIFDNMLDSSTKVYLNGSEISNTVEYLNYGWNEISCYNPNYAPYYINRYIQNNDTLFITTSSDPGISMQLIPSTTDNTCKMSYELPTFNTDKVHVNPNTVVSFNVMKQGYSYVQGNYTPTQSCRLEIPMQEEVIENVNLSGTFDSSGYSKNYMANALYSNTSHNNNIVLENGAIVCKQGNYSYVYGRTGYIRFRTPTTGNSVISVTCSLETTNTTAGGIIICSKNRYPYTFNRTQFRYEKQPEDTMFYSSTATTSQTYTMELENGEEYYLQYCVCADSGGSGLFMRITNISFPAGSEFSGKITITDLEGNNIGEITE